MWRMNEPVDFVPVCFNFWLLTHIFNGDFVILDKNADFCDGYENVLDCQLWGCGVWFRVKCEHLWADKISEILMLSIYF